MRYLSGTTFNHPSAGTKAGNQTRLIYHLSYDFKDSGLGSLNAYTPEELCKVKYNDRDHAVRASFKWRNKLAIELGIPQVYYSKIYVQSAFRICH